MGSSEDNSLEQLGIPELEIRFERISKVLQKKQDAKFEKKLRERREASTFLLKKRPKDQSIEEAYADLAWGDKWVTKKHRPFKCNGRGDHDRKPAFLFVNVFDPTMRWCDNCREGDVVLKIPEEVKETNRETLRVSH